MSLKELIKAYVKLNSVLGSNRLYIYGGDPYTVIEELVNLHYIPIYKHPYYQTKYKIKDSNFPQAEKYYEEAISLPIFYDLKESEIKKIIKILITPINHQTIF